MVVDGHDLHNNRETLNTQAETMALPWLPTNAWLETMFIHP
jgi:hypothetical protein